MLTVKDLEKRPELILISDSQDIRSIVEHCVKAEKVEETINGIGCLFVEIIDGDYGDIYICEYSTAWNNAPVMDFDQWFETGRIK